MICEYCKNEHDGSYGSGRFCCSKCARGFSTSKKREDINKKVSSSLKGYRTVPGGKVKLCDYGCGKEANHQLKNGKWCCENSFNKCISIREKNSNSLKKSHKNGNHNGFPPNAHLKGHKKFKENLQNKYKKMTFEEKPIAEKRRIILNDQDNKCLICGINKWMGKPLTLHLDHIDGNRNNWNRNNLRFICPNCHSQTETYCKGNNKNVSNDELQKFLLETNFNLSKTLELANLFPGGYNWKRVQLLAEKMCQDDGTR